MWNRSSVWGVLAGLWLQPALADNFARLDPALPSGGVVSAIAPVFDFDSDGCYPSAGISRAGVQNGGLNPSGSITGGCRSASFYDTSNTYHRQACVTNAGVTYCAHFFALYFLKDQTTDLGGGHRHDWEYAAIWTQNGQVTHGGYSAHGDLFNSPISSLQKENGRLKIVYHKDGVSTHALRFAKAGEAAENAYRSFITPAIVSWDVMYGDGLNNAAMRDRLNRFNYGSANVPIRDSSFLSNINKYKPAGYPAF